MKTAYLLLFLATFSLKVVGQDFPNLVDNRTVTTVTYWEPGDKHTYLVTKSKEKSGRDDKESVKRATSYEISFEVMEVTETSNTVKMMYDNYTYDDSDLSGEMETMLSDILSLSAGLEIIYETDELGQFQTIVNKAQVSKVLQQQYNLVIKRMVEQMKEEVDADDEQLMQLTETMSKLGNVMISEENVDAIYMEDFNLFHGIYGYELKLKQKQLLEFTYPVMDKTLNGEGSVELTEIHTSTDQFKIVSKDSPYEEEVNQFIKELFDLMAPEGAAFDPDAMGMKLEIRNQATRNFELSTGWLLTGTFDSMSTVKVGGRGESTTQHCTIRRL